MYAGSEVECRGDTRVDTHAADKMPPIRRHAEYRERLNLRYIQTRVVEQDRNGTSLSPSCETYFNFLTVRNRVFFPQSNNLLHSFALFFHCYC